MSTCTALVSSGPLYYSGSYISATLSSSSTANQECGRCLFPPRGPVAAVSFSVARFQTCSALGSAQGWKRNGILKTSPTPVKGQRSEHKKEGDRIFQQVWLGGVVPFTCHLHLFGDLNAQTGHFKSISRSCPRPASPSRYPDSHTTYHTVAEFSVSVATCEFPEERDGLFLGTEP